MKKSTVLMIALIVTQNIQAASNAYHFVNVSGSTFNFTNKGYDIQIWDNAEKKGSPLVELKPHKGIFLQVSDLYNVLYLTASKTSKKKKRNYITLIPQAIILDNFNYSFGLSVIVLDAGIGEMTVSSQLINILSARATYPWASNAISQKQTLENTITID
jgi:hypothetical protein